MTDIAASILMPMKNAEKYVGDAIQSILFQTHRNFELIIVDDGSSDSSRDIIRSFADSRIKVVSGTCQGISEAFNLALSHATGEIVFRCDADDLYPVNRLKSQIDWLHNHPEYGSICGSFSSIDQNGKLVCNYDSGDEEDITDELLAGMTRTHYCTYAVKREVLVGIGGCRPYFETAEDLDLQYRIAEKCKVYFAKEKQYLYRLHDSSTIHQQAHNKRKFFDHQAQLFLKQRLDRGDDDLQAGIAKDPPDAIGSRNRCDVHIQGNLLGLAWNQHASGLKSLAIKTGLKACLVNPSSPNCWKSFVMLLLK